MRAFQRDNNLTADGVCGAVTLAAIQKAYSGSSSATTTYNAIVYKLDWSYMKSNATALGIAKGASIKLTDLTTGKSLNVHVQSNGNHIDAEPLTSADTTTLCDIYGVSTPGAISYKRRPMMITTSAGQFLCSIYGQPHGAQDITNNGYEGQFCLHFVNSKTHGTNRVDKDHQDAINTAETLVKAVKVNGVNVDVRTTFK